MRILIQGGDVFDGTGSPPQPADVVVESGRIIDVGIGLDGDSAIDATGLTVLPGLIDCHVHVIGSGFDVVKMASEPFSYQFYAAQRNLMRTLDIGVTTVRDAAGADLGMKYAVEDGSIDGADLSISINMLSQTGGHGDGWNIHGDVHRLYVPHPGRPDGVVDGVEQMRQRVRELARAGADVIKVCTSGGVLSPRDDPQHPQFSPEELAVCVAEAAAAGLGVMAHAHGKPGIKNALVAGVRSIEHGIYLDDECIDLMLKGGTWLVPTLLAPIAMLEAVDAGARLPQNVVDKARAVIEIHQNAVARAIAAGVQIAMGTDSGVFPHGRNTDELGLMAAAGMTGEQALVSATSSAARLLGAHDRIGRVISGLQADLTLIAGDPLDFAGYRDRVRYVIRNGRIARDFNKLTTAAAGGGQS
jgi:imidazolonepropionase-like amidohydrolase